MRQRAPSKFMHLAVGRIQFLAGGWTEGPHSFLAIGRKPPSVPCHVTSPQGSSQHGSWALGERARKAREESWSFTAHSQRWHPSFSPYSIVGSKSLSLVQLKGMTAHGQEYQEVGTIRTHFRSCLPVKFPKSLAHKTRH